MGLWVDFFLLDSELLQGRDWVSCICGRHWVVPEGCNKGTNMKANITFFEHVLWVCLPLLTDQERHFSWSLRAEGRQEMEFSERRRAAAQAKHLCSCAVRVWSLLCHNLAVRSVLNLISLSVHVTPLLWGSQGWNHFENCTALSIRWSCWQVPESGLEAPLDMA